MRGQIILGDLVLAVARRAVFHWNMVRFSPSPQPTAEPARHTHQVCVIELLIAAVERPPPAAEPAAIHALWKICVENDSIHAVIRAFEEICVLLGQRVRHEAIILQIPTWRRILQTPSDSATRDLTLPRRGHFFAAQSAKRRSTYTFRICANRAEKVIKQRGRRPVAE